MTQRRSQRVAYKPGDVVPSDETSNWNCYCDSVFQLVMSHHNLAKSASNAQHARRIGDMLVAMKRIWNSWGVLCLECSSRDPTKQPDTITAPTPTTITSFTTQLPRGKIKRYNDNDNDDDHDDERQIVCSWSSRPLLLMILYHVHVPSIYQWHLALMFQNQWQNQEHMMQAFVDNENEDWSLDVLVDGAVVPFVMNGANGGREQDGMDRALKFSRGFYLKKDSAKKDSKHNCTMIYSIL